MRRAVAACSRCGEASICLLAFRSHRSRREHVQRGGLTLGTSLHRSGRNGWGVNYTYQGGRARARGHITFRSIRRRRLLHNSLPVKDVQFYLTTPSSAEMPCHFLGLDRSLLRSIIVHHSTVKLV